MDLPLAAYLLKRWVTRRTRRNPIRPLSELRLSELNRVLLVLTTGLGDAVLSTPVFEAVRRALPRARIGLFIRASWAPLFYNEIDLDEVIPYPGKWRQFFTTLDRLRNFSPELTLILHGNDPDILPLAYLAGSRFVVRVPTSGTRFPNLLSNLERKEDASTLEDWHYIDNRLRILDSVGIPYTRRTPILRSGDDTKVSAWLLEACANQPYVVIHPWAADSYKTWPFAQARQFMEIFEVAFPGYHVIVTGAVADGPVARQLVEGLRHAHNAAGMFGIASTAALLAGAKAVVAPDTGILHMAAALDVPTVGLYAPTNPKLVGQRAASAITLTLLRPLTCSPCMEKNCPHKPSTCMSQFDPPELIQALRTCLDSSK